MSLYVLAPKLGCERYTIHVGRHPRRTLFATVADFGWQPGTDGPDAPDFVYLGLCEEVVDPTVIVAAVAPYAIIPDTLLDQLRADMRSQPVRCADSTTPFTTTPADASSGTNPATRS